MIHHSLLLLLSSLVAGALGAARTTPPSGAIVVAKSGGNYNTIQAAVNSASSGAVIFIQPGTYEEQVLIPSSVGALAIYGYTQDDQDYSKNQVILTHRLGSDEAGSNDASGTLRAKNNGLKVYNLNIVNSRGQGVQAIALSAYGSEQGYYGCQFSGYQDTILSNQGNHYFHKCYIEGATDFIFGSRAIAWFESCTIGISGKGYITANGRDSAENPSWYVLNKATVKALSGVSSRATYLGRPWRTYARVVFQNSNLGSVVNSAGWSAWGSNPTNNVYYGEYGNTGTGASGTRVSWAKKLNSPVSISSIFSSTSWLDSSYIGSTSSLDAIDNSEASTSPESGATTLQTVVKASNTPTVSPSLDIVTLESASDDCSGTPDGFASLNGGTTGGSGGQIVTVSTQADLEKYAGTSGKYVIKVKGKITITPKGKEVKVTSDKTIVGIGSDAEINEGGFRLQNQRNVIFRNIRIGNTYVEGDEDGKTQDFDGIQMDSCTNIWIDHVHLERCGDGLIDSRKDTTFLTVSWTILRNQNKAFGIGWTDNVVSQMTLHHNYFDKTAQRNPSVDNVKHAHLYNNYLVGQTSYGHYARGKTEMRLENCYFKSVKNPITADSTAKLNASGNKFESTSGTTAKNAGEVFDPASFYKYTVDPVANVPSIVANGAGRQASICPS